MVSVAASARRMAVATGFVAVGSAAQGQMIPPDDSLITFSKYTAVRERIIPGYVKPGIPIGSFRLYPSLTVAPQYNDNILALNTPRVDDILVRATPAARLQSNWSNTSLSLNAAGQFDRYAGHSSENANGADVSAYAMHDLGSDTRIRAYGRFQSGRESRESQNAFVLTERPISFDTQTAALGLSHRFAAVRVSAEAGVIRSDFDDGLLPSRAVLDQDYRDSERQRLRVRAEVAQSPSLAYFAQATLDDTDYDEPSAIGSSRNSNSFEILGGVRAELPVLMRGELGLGYLKSTFEGAQFREFSGLAINSRLQFFPSQLTTVTLTAERSVNDAGIPNSSGYLATAAALQVDHELLRSLILGLNAGYERDTFNGIDRRDRRFTLGASADYRMNRFVSLRLSYDRLDLKSDGMDQYKSFARNRMLLSVSLGL